MRIRERNNSAGTEDSKEGGGDEVLQVHVWLMTQVVPDELVMQLVPLQPMEVKGGADIHLQPMEKAMPQQVDVP